MSIFADSMEVVVVTAQTDLLMSLFSPRRTGERETNSSIIIAPVIADLKQTTRRRVHLCIFISLRLPSITRVNWRCDGKFLDLFYECVHFFSKQTSEKSCCEDQFAAALSWNQCDTHAHYKFTCNGSCQNEILDALNFELVAHSHFTWMPLENCSLRPSKQLSSDKELQLVAMHTKLLNFQATFNQVSKSYLNKDSNLMRSRLSKKKTRESFKSFKGGFNFDL
jgi:hypothetical protein